MTDDVTTEAPCETPTGEAPPRRKRGRGAALAILALAVASVAVVWAFNYAMIARPVAAALDADPRNAGYSMSAHYRYYVDTATLVLDLRDIRSAAPVDLFRAIFQCAATLHTAGRRFDRVILARTGTPVFVLTGESFGSLGAEFAAGQNPVYLIRTLPERLYRPTGEAAFGRWEGGLLGVLGKQMDDANEAARRWIHGQ